MTMKMQLSKTEMLALWKRRHFLEPLRADCRISRSDGADLDAIATDRMRQWYLDMLANAPVELLAPVDITKSTIVSLSPTGSAVVMLPENVVRVIAVKLSGWEREATIVKSDTPESLRQHNAFARGGVCTPVAVLNSNRSLELFTPANVSAKPMLAYLLVAQDTGPETYLLDERGFETITLK